LFFFDNIEWLLVVFFAFSISLLGLRRGLYWFIVYHIKEIAFNLGTRLGVKVFIEGLWGGILEEGFSKQA